MVIVPDLMTTMPGQKLDLNTIKAVQTMIIAHCEGMRATAWPSWTRRRTCRPRR